MVFNTPCNTSTAIYLVFDAKLKKIVIRQNAKQRRPVISRSQAKKIDGNSCFQVKVNPILQVKVK